MKEYDITLRIASDNLMLKDISEIIRRKPISGSYNKGDMRGGRISDKTWFFAMSWKSLQDISTKQADRYLKRLVNAKNSINDKENFKTVLDIAVFSDYQSATIILPDKLIEWAGKNKMDIRITTYLCTS